MVCISAHGRLYHHVADLIRSIFSQKSLLLKLRWQTEVFLLSKIIQKNPSEIIRNAPNSNFCPEIRLK